MAGDIILINYLLSGSIILGITAVIMALFAKKYLIIESHPNWLKYRAIAIFFISIGFIIHTAGDFIYKEGSAMDLSIESVGHMIIFIGFIFLFYTAREVLKIAEEYGFN